MELEKRRYSPDLIRQLEDPEYARAAAEYEAKARAERARRLQKERQKTGYSFDDFDYDEYEKSRYKPAYSYDDYLAAREAASHEAPPPRAARSGGGHDGGGRDHSRKKQKKPKKKKSLGKRIRRILLILIILIILLVAYIMSITSNLDRVDTSDYDLGISDKAAEDLKDYRNIAILGSDARKGEGYDGSRTDAIIILSINKKTGDVKMISVMRDSYVKMTGPDGELMLDKLTHAHAYGGGPNTIAALNRTLDLNIEEFVIFNWKAVADTVDTLGGIEVDVKKKEIGDLNHWGPETGKNVGKKYHKIKKKGVQTLDGVQATTYCRIRKNSGGDKGRGDRYKKVMSAVMKKAATHPWKAGALSKDVMPQIRTNMSQTDLMSFMAQFPRYDIGKSISWPKANNYYDGLLNEVWYVVPRTLETNVKWLHKKAFGQTGYKLSKQCRQINEEIIYTTGVM